MSRRRWLWALLVFGLTLLIELPARWLLAPLPLAQAGVQGSLWHGQASRLGDLGVVEWRWQPWRLRLQVDAAYQRQHWQLRVNGWPWSWRASLQPGASDAVAVTRYQLAGQWQGALNMQGRGLSCMAAEGSLQANDLALLAPWQLQLGHVQLRMECQGGWLLLGQLQQAGQHQAELRADLLTRRAKLTGRIEPDSALQPLLVSARWLPAGGTQVARDIRW